jgi:1-acyl-sn-glycerol-3-phosphate acyltransferase
MVGFTHPTERGRIVDDFKLEPARDHGLAGRDRQRSYQREGGLVSTISRFAWWSMVRTSLKVLHRLEVQGHENIPENPSFMLVANHASHLDALVLGAILPLNLRDQLFPLAAGDVFFETPVLSAFSATVLNALPVWRKHCGPHAIQDLRKRLTEEPTVFILFPEGARSRDGKMMEFKPGIGMMTAETEVPIIPCHLQGTFEAFPPMRFVPRLKKVTVRIGKPRLFKDIRNRRAGWEEIAATLKSDICALDPAQAST